MNLPVTSISAAAFGLFYVLLSMIVIKQRFEAKTSHGPAADPKSPLGISMRVHGNFAEYIPFCLILMGLLEMNRVSSVCLMLASTLLFVGRLLHWKGLATLTTPNPYRVIGVVMTFTVFSLMCLWLLVLAL